MKYDVVDVFAERPLEGNPLSVVHGAEGLSDAQMQAIARETNHSETTFVTGHADDGTPQVRIFTPQTELPFAGHPTLGTAFATNADALDLNVGRIPIERQGDVLWMTQKPATFEPLSVAMMSDCLGVDAVAATVASTGTPVALVRVADSDAVRAAQLNIGKYTGPDIAVAYIFATNSDHDIHARSLAEFVGIKEDPATGGAAGPLAGWLHTLGELPGERTVHQGIEMQRPSQLRITGTVAAPRVGGNVQRVASGTFHL